MFVLQRLEPGQDTVNLNLQFLALSLVLCLLCNIVQINRLLLLDALNPTGESSGGHLHRLRTLLELSVGSHIGLIQQLNLVLVVVDLVVNMVLQLGDLVLELLNFAIKLFLTGFISDLFLLLSL